MHRAHRLALIGLLLIATVWVYRSTLTADFVYEDPRSVVHQPVVNGQAPWSPFVLRSVSNLTYRANYLLGGVNPAGYHLVNVLIHCLNGLILFATARRIVAEDFAFASMGLFLLHPMNSQAVSYVSGRTELVACSFVLLALYFTLGLWRWWTPIAVGACGVLAMASKEAAVAVVALVPWALICVKPGAIPRRVIAAALVLMLASVGALVYLLGFVSPHAIGSERGGLGFLAIQSWALWRYLALVIWPVGFSLDHDVEIIPHAHGYLALLGVIGCGFAAWRLRLRWPFAAFSVGWVVLAVAPRFAIRIPEFFNEHHTYTPFLGVWIGLPVLIVAIRDYLLSLRTRALRAEGV